MTRELKPHGTEAARKRHVRRGEPACEACRGAQAAYARERRSDPEIVADERKRNAARSRAAWRLVAEYPERFKELFIEEVTR